tara:strand:- start:132 stop:395 length:264 start_codon:yes stop_codon:yes gene_type:complete
MKISKAVLRRIIKEETQKLLYEGGYTGHFTGDSEQLAGGMGHVPAPESSLYNLGYDDGVSEEEPDPNYAKNAGYMKGYENGLMDIRS